MSEQSLEEIDNHLRDAGTPYLGGERPNARDLELAPKVYHVTVAMKEYKVGILSCLPTYHCVSCQWWMLLLRHKSASKT